MSKVPSLSVRDLPYREYSNQQLAAIPVGMFALAVLVLAGWAVVTGAPVTLGVEFTGGAEVKIAGDGEVTERDIEQAFSASPTAVQEVPSDGSYLVTFREGTLDGATAQSEAEENGLDVRSVSTVSASFGGETQRLAILGIGGAFILAAAGTTTIAMSPLAILSLGDLRGFAIFTILGVFIGVTITRPAYGDILRYFTTNNN